MYSDPDEGIPLQTTQIEFTDKLPVQIKQALDPLNLLNCDKVIRMSRPRPGEIPEW